MTVLPDFHLGLRALVPYGWNGASRAAVVVFGGMLALQSSRDIDLWKLIYLAVAIIAVFGSLLAVYRMRRRTLVVRARPWLVASVVAGAIIALSLPVALARGTEPTDWLRDASAYGLFAVAPWLALDAATSTSSRRLMTLLVAASAVSVFSFTVEWMERRQLADIPIDRITLPSFFLAAAFFSLSWAYSQSLIGWWRWIWVLLGGLALGMFLLTATRSTVVLLAAPAAMAFLLLRAKRTSDLVGLAGQATVQVLLALLVVFAGQSLIRGVTDAGIDPGIPRPPSTTERFDTIDEVVAGGDNSLRERIAQTTAAVNAFLDEPLLGVGPGYRFEWPNYAGEVRATSTLDTPAVVLAKFGILGILLALTIAGAYATFAWELWKEAPGSAISNLSVAFGAIALIWLPLGWPLEDKGFSLSLVFLLAAGFAVGAANGKASVEGA